MDFESYKKWWDSQNSLQNKLLRSLKPVHLVLFGILIFVGLKLWQSEGTNKNVIIGIIGGIIIIIIIANMKQTGKLNPIPESTAWILAQRDVGRKIANNQVPTGTEFKPTTISKLIHWGTGFGEGIPFRWKLLFIQKTPDNLETKMIYSMHPFHGYCTGFYPGTEADVDKSDIKFITSEFYTEKVEEKTETK